VVLPLEELTGLSDEDLQKTLISEMVRLHESGAGMRLELAPEVAYAVVAMCQLGLRHPRAGGVTAQLAGDFIQQVRGKFLPHAPAVAESIRRGNDRAFDKEAAPSAT
jgi:hypothetical protein